MTRTVDPITDPYDKLAAMFLSDGNRPDPETPAVESGPIELAIAGHLPVRGAIWLTPYADAVAQQEGPTALLRLDGDEPSIEVRGETGDDGNLLQGGECRTVREAIMHLGPLVRTWIVRPAANAEPAELLGTGQGPGVDRITILSSADQAAVTNVYMLVKEITTAARAMGRDLPRLGLAMIGSPRERAAMQARRIDATAREHLEVSVPMSVSIEQMGSIRSTGLRVFPGQGRPPLSDVLAWITTARARRRPAPASPAPASPAIAPPVVNTRAMSEGIERALEYGRASTPSPSREAPPRVAPPAADAPPAESPSIDVPSGPRSIPPVAPAPAAQSPDAAPPLEAPNLEDVIRGVAPLPAAPAPHAAPAGPSVKLPPRGVSEVEPKHASPPREPDQSGCPVPLAHHVTDVRARTEPGAPAPHLTPLVARCPGHERIELAVDAAGRVHVLAREEDVRGLPVVQTWARANRELIAMAHPALPFDPAKLPVPHVFAADPLRVADLHASSMHLHVLTPIDVDGKRTWYTAALNRPV